MKLNYSFMAGLGVGLLVGRIMTSYALPALLGGPAGTALSMAVSLTSAVGFTALGIYVGEMIWPETQKTKDDAGLSPKISKPVQRNHEVERSTAPYIAPTKSPTHFQDMVNAQRVNSTRYR